jgi:hypothetical protein
MRCFFPLKLTRAGFWDENQFRPEWNFIANWGEAFGVVGSHRPRILTDVSRAKDLKDRLARVKRTRQWLAEETGYALDSVRQYLGGARRSVRFEKKALAVLEAEEVRQKTAAPVPPQWNLIFTTEEQFNRVDRASRIVEAESFTDFCREAILAKADEILEKKKRAAYPKMKPMPPARVAEGKGE